MDTSIRDTIVKVDLQRIISASKDLFINMDKVIETLYFASITGQNAILHGPGGFGKTEVVRWFYEYLNIPIYTKVCSIATTVEDLIGIPDMELLRTKSEYKVAFEKSIFNNKGILLLEEGLDMQPEIAASLKDILTSGGYNQGGELIPSYISSVIITTNKNPDDAAIDLSTAAFYKERFPHVINVKWNELNYANYHNLLTTSKHITIKDELILQLLASIFEDNKLSPRHCIYYSQVIDVMGIDYITSLLNLNTTSLKDLNDKAKLKSQTHFILSSIKNIEKYLTTKNASKLELEIANAKYLICPETLIEQRDDWVDKANNYLKNVTNTNISSS